jgi:ParB family chromosome partitioning protein
LQASGAFAQPNWPVLVEVPAIVQDYADERILEIALIENIQREDLNPMETAQALERLHTEMNLSHEEIAARTGKDRTTITNMIRLLRCPRDVQLLVAERRSRWATRARSSAW